MQLLPAALYRHHILQHLLKLLPLDVECWLVGGALRDVMLDREVHDFDFALSVDPEPFVRRLASVLKGTYVPLDPHRKQSRIVVKRTGAALTLDFAMLRADSLEGDLELRDFTCNAMASSIRNPGGLLDPLDGRKDLLYGLLRPCSEAVLEHDPLRMIKGLRHCVELNLVPTDSFAEQCRRYHGRLTESASERVKVELGRIFAHPYACRGIRMLHHYQLLNPLLPDIAQEEGIDLSAAGRVTAAGAHLSGPIDTALEKRLEEGWPLFALVRLYASFRIAASHATVLNRLRFSRKARSLFHQLAAAHEHLALPESSAPDRARALWVDSLGSEPAASILYLESLPAYAKINLGRFYSDWLQHQVEGRVPDLISADDLVVRWGIPPGPGLGRGLEAVRRDEIGGRISKPFSTAEIVEQYFKKD